jgi:hypothetical protein
VLCPRFIQNFLDGQSRFNYGFKSNVLRVQIDHQIIRRSSMPRRELQGLISMQPRLAHVHQRGGVLTKQKTNLFVLRLGTNGHSFDPLRMMLECPFGKSSRP